MALLNANESFDSMLELLPESVRTAIQTVDFKSELKILAQAFRLHFDQWEQLEGEIQLMLVGARETDQLEQIVKDCIPSLSDEERTKLVAEIGLRIFIPVREALEDVLGQSSSSLIEQRATSQRQVSPSTPPADPPTEKAERAPVSVNYSAGQPSHERPIIQGDPYREQL